MLDAFFSQLIKKHSTKLDHLLQNYFMDVNTIFLTTPPFLQIWYENFIKQSKGVDVIIEFHDEHCHSAGVLGVEHAVTKHGFCKLSSEFPIVSCCSATLTPVGLEYLLDHCGYIKKVHLDYEVKAVLDVATPSVEAKNVWGSGGQELDGSGVTIAILDTGIYPHEDLAGRVVGFVDFINSRTTPYDDNGHGTHCAGDAAGSGLLSSGAYAGPAPNAKLIGVKVLDKLGSGSLSTIMDGIQWCMNYNQSNSESEINILSMSLGSLPQYENVEDDPLIRMVHAAWDRGITVIAAAGNDGPEEGTISSPGVSTRIITVGAMNDRDSSNRSDDVIADFSSRGPTIYGDVKPDVVAPGVDIVSLRAPGSYLDRYQRTNRVGEHYYLLSGTSMATPICAGVAALILQENPSFGPDDVKNALLEGAESVNGCSPIKNPNNVYGYGYVNAKQAL